MSAAPGERKIRCGLIGAGAMGSVHAEHVASRIPEAELIAIADADRGAAEACAARCGVSAVHDDYRALLADPGIDAIVICSPVDTHADIIEEAAHHGKHIFCEKPLDRDPDRMERALAAVARAGVKLQVGFNRRFDAGIREVRDTVASGKIGQPYTLRIVSRDPVLPAPPRPQDPSWLLLESTIHGFDMARYLLGSEIVSVYALAAPMVYPHSGADTALVTLRFTDGAMGTIENGQTRYGYDQRVEVFGSEGAVFAENEQPHRVLVADRQGAHAAGPLTFFRERYATSYLAELSAFINCILQDTEPPVIGEDGRIAVELALAALRSLEEERPVAVGPVEGL